MSFKREGDDHSWLNMLNKRRVSELFAEHIPEDEAYLMKNGSLACLVCSYRPVFDSVSMLAVHRGGRRHLANLEVFLARKAEIDDLLLKRHHEEYASSGKVSTEIPVTSNFSHSKPRTHKLLGACLYDSRSKRRKNNVAATGRRLAVDMSSSYSVDSGGIDDVVSDMSCATHNSRPVPQTIADILKHKAAMRSVAERQTAVLKPYIGKHSTASNFARRDGADFQAMGCQSHGLHRRGDEGLAPHGKETSRVNGTSIRTVVEPSCSVDVIDQLTQTNAGAEAKLLALKPSDVLHAKSQMSDRIAGFLDAFGSGWKRSRDGTWIKDEEAEFNSDDEPPDVV